jgi:hypothetical protein
MDQNQKERLALNCLLPGIVPVSVALPEYRCPVKMLLRYSQHNTETLRSKMGVMDEIEREPVGV